MSARSAVLCALALAGCRPEARPAAETSAPPKCVPPVDDGATIERVTWDMSWEEAKRVLAQAGLCVDESGFKGTSSWFSADSAHWHAVVYFDDDGARDHSRRNTMNQLLVHGKELPSPGEADHVVRRMTRRFGAEPDIEVKVDGVWENPETRLFVEQVRDGERWGLRENWMSLTNSPVCAAPSTGPAFRAVDGWRGVRWYSTFEAMREALSRDRDVSLGALDVQPTGPNACGDTAFAEVHAGGAKGTLRFTTCHRGPLGLEYVNVLADDPITNGPAPHGDPEAPLEVYVSAWGPPCSVTRTTTHHWKNASTEAWVRVSFQRMEATWSTFQILTPTRARKR